MSRTFVQASTSWVETMFREAWRSGRNPSVLHGKVALSRFEPRRRKETASSCYSGRTRSARCIAAMQMINATRFPAVDFDTSWLSDERSGPKISTLVNPAWYDGHRYFNWPSRVLESSSRFRRVRRETTTKGCEKGGGRGTKRKREKEGEREKERPGPWQGTRCVSSSCRNSEENQFDGSPLAGVRLAIISEHAEEIIGCSGVPSKTSDFVGNLHKARRFRARIAFFRLWKWPILSKTMNRMPDEEWQLQYRQG